MKIQLEKDKKLPQRYITIAVTDAEARALETKDTTELFTGLPSAQIRKICVFGLIYSFFVETQEKESKRIFVPTNQERTS